MYHSAIMRPAPTLDTLTTLVIEPLPFHRKSQCSVDVVDYANDPFVQSVLQLLLTIDDTVTTTGGTPAPEHAAVMSTTWPQLTTIAIPANNAIHLMTATADVVMTPDDQRALPSIHALTMSPGGGTSNPSGGPGSRKRLRVETFNEKNLEALGGDEDSQFQKRLLTNTRRDAVATLREEARALETTLKGLYLRQSRPNKAALVSNDPDALVKSYAENIQLKRAIEEQDARIKTLRRAVSLQDKKAGSSGTSTDVGQPLLALQLS